MMSLFGLCSAVLLQLLVSSSSSYFPRDFAWGTATSAYQIEGYWEGDQRGLSIWDTFSHQGKCKNNNTGDVADDHYMRFLEDIPLIKNTSLLWYRFSISWSRIYPNGTGTINELGLNHYKAELQALQANGINPVVTLYHWDLPEALEQQGGWRNASIVDAFTQYAETCFEHFGPYVKLWITINEPFVVSWLGHGLGIHAPGRCSSRSQCPEGDSSTEPYIVAHHLLLSHAKVYQLFKDQYKNKLKTKIGISLNSDWVEPWRADSEKDKEAAQRYLEFSLGWFADPIFFGDYPQSMKNVTALPIFTEEQKLQLKGSTDFFGLNHYTSSYAKNGRSPGQYGWENDSDVTTTQIGIDNKTIGTPSGCSWLFVVPQGFRKLLNYIKNRYNNTEIYVTENGVSVPDEATFPLPDALKDKFRISYLNDYMNQMLLAIEDGVKVKGYFVWSLLDNFEWADGYSIRFGLYYVDYTNNLTRYPKDSLTFLKAYITDYTEPEWRWLFLLFGIPSVAIVGIVGYCIWRDRISKSKYNIVDS